LWARIEADWWGYNLLRAPGDDLLRAIPPISFDLVDRHRPSNDVFTSDRAWARTYAEMLQASANSPLSEGHWHLGYYGNLFDQRQLEPKLVNMIVGQKPHGFIQWDFGTDIYPITLRDMSHPESGRVKAWRKVARANALPPVLLYWVSGLAAYVVLDGHDRLLAASLEGTGVSALSLEPLRTREIDAKTKDAVLLQVSKALAAADVERARPPSERLARANRLMDVPRANELLLNVFLPDVSTGPTRAFPLTGGSAQWAREVLHALDARKINDRSLLDGLEATVVETGA
jgi:hypothetical protein